VNSPLIPVELAAIGRGIPESHIWCAFPPTANSSILPVSRSVTNLKNLETRDWRAFPLTGNSR
jgi:hypothetical protein